MVAQVLADARQVVQHLDAMRPQPIRLPMPDSSSSCGELIDPGAQTTTSRAARAFVCDAG